MQISKSDLSVYSQFTTNVEDRMINFHILNARKYDVQPYLTSGLMDAIIALADDSDNELSAFYNDYVKEVWSLAAYIRFLTEHGVNVTQFGLTKPNDPRGTFTQASEQERANILRQNKSDMDVAVNQMTDRLKAVNFTFDSVVYSESDSINHRNRMISAVRKKQTRPFGESRDSFYKDLI